MAKFFTFGTYGQAFFDLHVKTEHGSVRGDLSRDYTWDNKWKVTIRRHNCRSLAVAEGILIAAAMRCAAKASAEKEYAAAVAKAAAMPDGEPETI